jgi:hypothetical protein
MATKFGKYRGTVINTLDPEDLGRIEAIVPDVDPQQPMWAMPCFPAASLFVVPEIGSKVWIEFEAGDVTKPIWSGCFFEVGDTIPVDLTGSQAGRPVIALTNASGAKIALTESGIYVDNGLGATIVLEGPSVSINNGALKVD